MLSQLPPLGARRRSRTSVAAARVASAGALALAALAAAPAAASGRIAGAPRVASPPVSIATPDGRPTAEGLAWLERRVRGRALRIAMDGPALQVRGAGLDTLGVTYRTPQGDRGRVEWSGIRALETRHTHPWRGAALGLFAGVIAASALADAAGSDPGPGILAIFIVPPLGAFAGAAVGASIPTWRREWPPGADAPGR